jgi:hypothetical protein
MDTIFRRRRHRPRKNIYYPYGHLTTIRRFGRGLSWTEMNGREKWVTSRRIKGAHTRNKFWKRLGYPNLVRAREALRTERERRIRMGEISPKRRRRLERIVESHVAPRDPNESRDAELFERGKQERDQRRILGGLVPAGLCDPQYLMRRELRILDAQRRSPRNSS